MLQGNDFAHGGHYLPLARCLFGNGHATAARLGDRVPLPIRRSRTSPIPQDQPMRRYDEPGTKLARGSDLQYALLNLPGALVSRVALTSDAAVERGDS